MEFYDISSLDSRYLALANKAKTSCSPTKSFLFRHEVCIIVAQFPTLNDTFWGKGSTRHICSSVNTLILPHVLQKKPAQSQSPSRTSPSQVQPLGISVSVTSSLSCVAVHPQSVMKHLRCSREHTDSRPTSVPLLFHQIWIRQQKPKRVFHSFSYGKVSLAAELTFSLSDLDTNKALLWKKWPTAVITVRWVMKKNPS